MTNTVKKTASVKEVPKTKVKEQTLSKTELENIELKKQMEEMKSMILGMMENKNSTNTSSQNIISQGFHDIEPNKLVKVTSLTYGQLNLKVNENKHIKFNKYGESKNIIYSDLQEIYNNNQRFTEEGTFYIHNEDAISNLGLSEIYKNLLSLNDINHLLKENKESIVNVFKNASESQRESIISLYIENCLVDKSNIDYNTIKALGDIEGRGRNIMTLIEDAKFLREYKEQ